MKNTIIFLALLFFGLVGCSTIYYGAMEKIGIHKRDIMVDRIKAARGTQDEAKKQFLTAMEAFKQVVNVQGGDLEQQYNKFKTTLDKTEAEAEAVRQRISDVEDVSRALFKEWRSEIDQYSSDSLRQASQRKYDLTKEKYEKMMAAMKAAEAKLEPALVPLRDQVLFMKHNLNARAIAGLSNDVVDIQTNVNQLILDMDKAIHQADAFIASFQAE